jgi:hypothetical protein
LVLLIGVAGCTEYRPVDWNGHSSWAQARSAAVPRGAESQIAGHSTRAGGQWHLVLPGETFSEVAVRYGTATATLAELNGVAPPYRLYAGQVLVIPAGRAKPRTVVAVAKPRPPAIAGREPPVPRSSPIRVDT